MDQPANPVECYSGGEYAERPRALHWQGMRLEIAQVLKVWRTPQAKCFRVRATDGRLFVLAYEAEADAWSIVDG
jgi:hypothetical protein